MAMTPSLNKLLSFKIRHAAKDDMLIICHCYRCRRQRIYWAADLVAIGHGEESVMEYDLACGLCGPLGRTRTWAKSPLGRDSGRFEILRPGGTKPVQVWRQEVFINPPMPLREGDVLPPELPAWRRRYSR